MTTRYQGSIILSSLILTITVSILVMLGSWQLSRMYEKQEYLADINSKMKQPVMSFIDAYQRKQATQNTAINVSGDIDKSHVWLLDNQPLDKKIGYAVYAPIKTAVGSVLINLGWVEAPGSRNDWPAITLPDSLKGVAGVITTPSVNPFIDDTVFEQRIINGQTVFRVQAINPAQQSKQSNTNYKPFTLTLTEPSENFVRRWEPVVMPAQKHLGYAIQWFGLAIAALIIGVIAINKSRRKNG